MGNTNHSELLLPDSAERDYGGFEWLASAYRLYNMSDRVADNTLIIFRSFGACRHTLNVNHNKCR